LFSHPLQARCNAGRDKEMFKTIFTIGLTIFAAGVLAQTSDAPPSLEVAQQRARYAREQMITAERKAQSAEQKDTAARKNLEDARARAEKTAAQAEQAAKELKEAQAEFATARERHDQAYKDLKRAYDASQESKKPQ
jgi:F0F1-type ATP synthase membrane subunit b/b'